MSVIEKFTIVEIKTEGKEEKDLVAKESVVEAKDLDLNDEIKPKVKDDKDLEEELGLTVEIKQEEVYEEDLAQEKDLAVEVEPETAVDLTVEIKPEEHGVEIKLEEHPEEIKPKATEENDVTEELKAEVKIDEELLTEIKLEAAIELPVEIKPETEKDLKLAVLDNKPLLPYVVKLQRYIKSYLRKTRLVRCVRDGLKVCRMVHAFTRINKRITMSLPYRRYQKLCSDEKETIERELKLKIQKEAHRKE